MKNIETNETNSDTSNAGILLLGAAALGFGLWKLNQQHTQQPTSQHIVHPTTVLPSSTIAPPTEVSVKPSPPLSPELTPEEEMKKFDALQSEYKRRQKMIEENVKKGFYKDPNSNSSILPLKDRLLHTDNVKRKFGFAPE